MNLRTETAPTASLASVFPPVHVEYHTFGAVKIDVESLTRVENGRKVSPVHNKINILACSRIGSLKHAFFPVLISEDT